MSYIKYLAFIISFAFGLLIAFLVDKTITFFSERKRKRKAIKWLKSAEGEKQIIYEILNQAVKANDQDSIDILLDYIKKQNNGSNTIKETRN